MEENKVKNYYDHNTSRFLFFHKDAGSRNIHQALWAENVHDLKQAINYSNHLIAQEIEHYLDQQALDSAKVMDLGCGVGSALFYLANHCEKLSQLIGITISPKQVAIANKWLQQVSNSQKCRFVEANFQALPNDLPIVNLIYSIEAFVHATNAGLYFEQVQKHLKSKGRLVIIDDFLADELDLSRLPKASSSAIDRFKEGWVLGSLFSVKQVAAFAERQQLHLVQHVDLSALLQVYTLREKAIRLFVTLFRPFLGKSQYFKSIIGGDARQYCLQKKLIEYQMLVFEKR